VDETKAPVQSPQYDAQREAMLGDELMILVKSLMNLAYFFPLAPSRATTAHAMN
jgi:hypothetical protein